MGAWEHGSMGAWEQGAKFLKDDDKRWRQRWRTTLSDCAIVFFSPVAVDKCR